MVTCVRVAFAEVFSQSRFTLVASTVCPHQTGQKGGKCPVFGLKAAERQQTLNPTRVHRKALGNRAIALTLAAPVKRARAAIWVAGIRVAAGSLIPSSRAEFRRNNAKVSDVLLVTPALCASDRVVVCGCPQAPPARLAALPAASC